MKTRLAFGLATLLLLLVEVCIALWVHDRWVRPFLGDALVVVLLYCAGRTLGLPRNWSLAVLVLACTVEVLQAFDFVDRLGLGHSRLARIVLGTTFSWGDFVAYFSGFLMVEVVHLLLKRGIAKLEPR